MGFVYLLLEVDKYGEEAYKIGISKNDPTKRNKNLQTGNPNKISVLNYYESSNYKLVERMLHAKYSLNKTLADNEWFHLDSDQVLAFLEDCKKSEETINFLKKENHFFK